MFKVKSLKFKVSRGQMLVEAIVAMGILTVAVFAVFSLLTRSTSLNRVISQQYVATYLAAEGLELAKNITDSNLLICGANWTDGAVGGSPSAPKIYEVDYTDSEFRPSTNRFLKISPSTGFYQYDAGEPSIFRRTISIADMGSGEDGGVVEIRVIARVTWRGRGGVNSEITLEDHFFKWRPAPGGCL